VKIQTYREFWPYYLDQHRHASTRLIHLVGVTSFFTLIALAIAQSAPWLALLAFLVFYLPAWVAHFVIERNRPATWSYPLWSFFSDIRMSALWVTGRLEPEAARARQALHQAS
jgi:hypothetical protein